MALIRINRSTLQGINKYRLYATTATNDEFTTTPEYPPILDLSYKARKHRKRTNAHDSIKSVRTIEEKQIKLNMPKYYGFHALMFKENNITFNSFPLIQHVTRTHFVQQTDLPEYYNKLNVDSIAKDVQQQIEEVVYLEFNGRRSYERRTEDIDVLEDAVTSLVTQQINRVVLNNLSCRLPHVIETQVDNDVRHEAFWFTGGIDPSENLRRCKKGLKWYKEYADEQVDRPVQYVGKPTVALRHEHPLLPVMRIADCRIDTYRVPTFRYDPRVLGCEREGRHGTNVPGFWPGDHSEFGLLSYQKRGHLLNRKFGEQDRKETVHCQGVLASYGWLLGQASYKGFNTYNDVTYPLVAQTIITNGRLWSFYVYQLNTLLVHGDNITDNPKVNMCWGTPELKLFERIDATDGKIIGFNDDVLKTLLKLYVNAPQQRLGLNMAPYLTAGEKRIADYEDEEKREWLERQYKHLMSNRPKHRMEYELYHWEKIYKVDHNTRQMEKRRRPFELFQNPFQRTLDDRSPDYIPRKLRPEGHRSKNKLKKLYYP